MWSAIIAEWKPRRSPSRAIARMASRGARGPPDGMSSDGSTLFDWLAAMRSAPPQLVVDPNAPLPCAVSPQQLQTTARQHAECVQADRGVEHRELALRRPRRIRRKPPDRVIH